MHTYNSSTSFNVSTLLSAEAARNPTNHAMRFGDMDLTFAEMIELSRRAAMQMQSDGVAPGDRVAVAISHPVRATVLVIALWLLDATPVVMDARSRAAERQKAEEFLDLSVVLQSRPPPGCEPFTALNCDDSWWQNLAHIKAPSADLATGTAPALISLSSGTTGMPMATGFFHDRYLHRLAGLRQPGLFWPGQVFLNPLTYSFSASVNYTFAHLMSGNAVEFCSPLASAAELAENVLRSGASFAFMTRPQIGGLLELESDPLKGSCLKVLFSGGAYLPEDQILAAMDRLAPVLGYAYSTSVAGHISINSGDLLVNHPGSVGRPLQGVHVEIIDDQGRPCPAGQPGHIRVASPAIASFAITPEGRKGHDRLSDTWAMPGDNGVLDADGRLTITGRSGTFIISSGATIYPEEIESTLEKSPHVASCVVLGVPSETRGEDVVAIVVAEGEPDLSTIRSYARAQFSPVKCPRRFYVADRLIYNANGKLDRAGNRKLLETLA